MTGWFETATLLYCYLTLFLLLLLEALIYFFKLKFHPCRCLCRFSVQMTRTTPLRRTILQFRQIFFTEAFTFITTGYSLSRIQ